MFAVRKNKMTLIPADTLIVTIRMSSGYKPEIMEILYFVMRQLDHNYGKKEINLASPNFSKC